MILEPLLSLWTTLFAQGANPGTGGGGDFWLMLPFMFLIFGIFYMMVWRPESKKRAQHDKMRTELKKNDRVLTIGGIYGTVVNAQQGSDDITIKVDEGSNVKLRITRSAVQTVLTTKEGSEKSAATN